MQQSLASIKHGQQRRYLAIMSHTLTQHSMNIACPTLLFAHKLFCYIVGQAHAVLPMIQNQLPHCTSRLTVSTRFLVAPQTCEQQNLSQLAKLTETAIAPLQQQASRSSTHTLSDVASDQRLLHCHSQLGFDSPAPAPQSGQLQ